MAFLLVFTGVWDVVLTVLYVDIWLLFICGWFLFAYYFIGSPFDVVDMY